MILLGDKGCKERESGLTIVSRMSDNPEFTGDCCQQKLDPSLTAHNDIQRQTAVTAYLESKKLLQFVFMLPTSAAPSCQ